MMSIKQQRRGTGSATISDVARLAGFSPMTVSRVINGGGNVKESTRDAINAAIKELNYSPNPAARSLAGVEPIRIGLLYSNPSAAYLSEVLVGSLDRASRIDVQLVVARCEPPENYREAAEHLLERGVHGLILTSPLCDLQEVVDVVTEGDQPVVALAGGKPSDDLITINVDDFEAAHAMTKHLIGLGHQRIGFIIGSPIQAASGRRLEGYRAALAEAGIPADEKLIEQGHFTYRSGLAAADKLMDLAVPPTAVFASNDDMAAAVVAVAHRRGLDVPNDLTVCGFDDTAFASSIWPELTTIRQPIAEMARTAVDMLTDEILAHRAGKSLPREHRIAAFELIKRQSDAPPKNSK